MQNPTFLAVKWEPVALKNLGNKQALGCSLAGAALP